jgi:hypothetical protein
VQHGRLVASGSLPRNGLRRPLQGRMKPCQGLTGPALFRQSDW